MNRSLVDIPSNYQWKVVKEINKGWSQDKKYYMQDQEGNEYIFRKSDIAHYDKKKKEFDHLQALKTIKGAITQPVDFGVCDEGRSVYLLLTWVRGEDARGRLLELSQQEQYDLGYQAGQILKQIHKIHVAGTQQDWAEKYNAKIHMKMDSYKVCGIKLHGDTCLIDYIENNTSLLYHRPQTFQHGDYHIGNMVITPEKNIGIIDFNRMDIGDPWEEFNRITWCAEQSYKFAKGYIDGYFDKHPPELFFKLMALYIAVNQLTSITWAIPFGVEEVDITLKQTEEILSWYNGFKTYRPSWYDSN